MTAPPRRPDSDAARPAVSARGRAAAARSSTLELKANVHKKLLNRLNLEALAQADRARAESEIRTLRGRVARRGRRRRSALANARRLFGELLDEVFGLGPLEPLLRDPDDQRHPGQHLQARVRRARRRAGDASRRRFRTIAICLRVIDRIVSGVGRRIDDSSPMVDARLPDGSRVNAIIPPLAVDGPLLSIRRFPAERLKADDLVTLQRADAADARLPVALRPRPAELPDQRRHRRRQDDAAQRAVELHRRPRAHRDDRGRRRAAAASGARRRAWKRGRPTSKARARSASGSS